MCQTMLTVPYTLWHVVSVSGMFKPRQKRRDFSETKLIHTFRELTTLSNAEFIQEGQSEKS